MKRLIATRPIPRKSLASVVPSGDKYLIFFFLKCVNELLLSKFCKTCFTIGRKKLHWPRLIWPTR